VYAPYVLTALLRSAVLLALFCGSAGCNTRPVAPLISDDPVYVNDREGFRFLMPEGWTQFSRSDVPPGKTEKERTLVEYKRTSGQLQALFEVSLADLPPGTDPATYLAQRSFGVTNWQLRGAPQKLTINDVAGTRYILAGKLSDQRELQREVVVFQRGERTYFFTGLFPPKDTAARDQIRTAVESVIWK
jgi:hypothetical protein